MVADKVIDHLQFVEEGFFVERFAPEVKPNRVKNFLILDSGKVGLLSFFVVFFEACHRFYDETETSQRSEHDRVQSDAPGNRRGYDSFACHNIAKEVFSLKAAVQFFVAVVDVQVFQHFDCAL